MHASCIGARSGTASHATDEKGKHIGRNGQKVVRNVMTVLRKSPGTYVLLLKLGASRPVEVGRLGTLQGQPGTYAYVGSAFGPGGVRARVRRHQRRTASPHWHIDYLRSAGRLRQAWHTYDAVRRECTWAEVLRTFPEAEVPLNGFGASDCGCPAHLVRFSTPPELDAFRRRLKRVAPDHAPVYSLDLTEGK